jgi:transcriptional regulator with XRE-family HTH domain
MINIHDIPKRIREERRRLGLTQDALADATGVSRSTIAGYEHGRSSADVTFLAALHAAKADINYILTGVRQSESAVEYIDWELLGSVLVAIHEFAESTGLTVSMQRQMQLVQILYPQAIIGRRVDKKMVAIVMQLAA